MSRQHGETTTMKTLYIFLTRSGTLLSNLVYSLTGAQYTHKIGRASCRERV